MAFTAVNCRASRQRQPALDVLPLVLFDPKLKFGLRFCCFKCCMPSVGETIPIRVEMQKTVTPVAFRYFQPPRQRKPLCRHRLAVHERAERMHCAPSAPSYVRSKSHNLAFTFPKPRR